VLKRIAAAAAGALQLWRGRILALTLLAGFVVLRAFDPGFLEAVRLPLFDALQRTAPREPQGTPVLIVDIDEHSLSRYGQWPWPRTLLGRLVDRVAAGGPLVIGLDLLFPEPDRLSPQRIVDVHPDLDPEIRERIAALPSNDTVFARSLAAAPSVLGAAAVEAEGAASANPGEVKRTPAMEQGGDPRPHLPAHNHLISSLPELVAAGRGQGLVSIAPERDGVIRRIPLAGAVGDALFPALSVEMIRVAAGAGWFGVHTGENGVEAVSVGEIAFPTQSDSRVWVHFSASRDARFVSAAEVLDGGIGADVFTNRIVLMGSTGIGLVDFPATPVGGRMPGVEIHAQLLETMISGRLLARIPHAGPVETAAVLVAGLVIIIAVPLLRPAWSVLPLAGVLVLLAAGTWIAYRYATLLADAAFPALTTVAVFGVMLGSSLVATDRARRLLAEDVERRKAEAQRLEGELAAARAIQMGILPREFPAFPERAEFDLHAMIEPARAVGGDLYDFAMIDDDLLYFMIGDVSGKGVPASLFMALTKALYKSSALRKRIAIDEIMTLANAEIARENPTMMFVTVLAGLLDVRTGELQFCNAGHDAPILVRPDGPPEAIDSAGGPPLCVLEDFDYPATTITLAPGQGLVLFTDGVTEAMSTAEALYSHDRLMRVLADMNDPAPTEIVRGLAADIHRHAEGAEPSDDITILAVRYLGAPS